MEALLKINDLERIAGISKHLIYKMVEEGHLPYIRVGRGRRLIRFRPDQIEQYLKAGEVPARA